MTATSSSPGSCRGTAAPAGSVSKPVFPNRDAVLELGQVARQPLGERRLVDEHARAAVLQHEAQPRRLLADAERHRDRPDLERREQRDQELRPVAEQQGDAIARPDAERGEACGGPGDVPLQLAIGEPQVARDQGLAVGPARDRRIEDRRHVRRALGEAADLPAEVPLAPERRQRVLRPGHRAQPCRRYAAVPAWLASCARISWRAIVRRWTSSGPSTNCSARPQVHKKASGVSGVRPIAP